MIRYSPLWVYTGKVTAVCDKLRSAMESIDGPGYTLARLTAMAYSRPPQLVEALRVVRGMKEAEISGSVAKPTGKPTAVVALRFLLKILYIHV